MGKHGTSCKGCDKSIRYENTQGMIGGRSLYYGSRNKYNKTIDASK